MRLAQTHLAQITTPIPIAFGKANGGTQLKLFGASSITGSGGIYTVTLDAARPDDNYIIQLTVSGNYIVSVFDKSSYFSFY